MQVCIWGKKERKTNSVAIFLHYKERYNKDFIHSSAKTISDTISWTISPLKTTLSAF
jgi:hypothetical protein